MGKLIRSARIQHFYEYNEVDCDYDPKTATPAVGFFYGALLGIKEAIKKNNRETAVLASLTDETLRCVADNLSGIGVKFPEEILKLAPHHKRFIREVVGPVQEKRRHGLFDGTKAFWEDVRIPSKHLNLFPTQIQSKL